MRLARSTLIVPLGSERFIAGAHRRGADAILLDLEDGVAANAKEAARSRLVDAVASVGREGARVQVRVNRSLGLMVRDLEVAVAPGVSSIVLPKVDSAGHVKLVSQFIGELERSRGLTPGGISLSAAIETPYALVHAREIAASDPRLEAISLGGLDMAAACGFNPTAEFLLSPLQAILFAAKAAGISARGLLGSVADFADLDAFRLAVRRSRSLGLRGGAAIHPDQIRVLNEEFSPSPEETADARAIVQLAAGAFSDGRGAFPYKGRMIDKPVVDAAEATLALGLAIDAQEARLRRLSVNTEL